MQPYMYILISQIVIKKKRPPHLVDYRDNFIVSQLLLMASGDGLSELRQNNALILKVFVGNAKWQNGFGSSISPGICFKSTRRIL